MISFHRLLGSHGTETEHRVMISATVTARVNPLGNSVRLMTEAQILQYCGCLQRRTHMAKHYRAFISMPITANGDEQALNNAGKYANSLLHAGSTTIGGHLELLTEVESDGLVPGRVVWEDIRFREQLP
jgi:hypothetical protein